MPGLDSAIAALIASRTDMLLSALLPQGGSTSGATAQTGTSQLLVDTPPFTVAVPPAAANAPPPASAQTALSDVARTLDAISRFGGQNTPPITSNAPLWPTAPRPVLAASTFASLSGSLFATPEASASVAAVDQAAPVLPAAALASVLAKTVSESGLFYESHIAQWLAGQRTIASLNNEPQARVDNATAKLPFDLPQPQPDFPADVWIDESLLPASFSADPADPMTPVRLVPMPLTPQQAAAMAASVRAVPPNLFSPPGPASGSGADATPAGPAGTTHDPAVQASINAGIHPSTIPLVRQQLDLFATNQFRWSGEAWPGAKFEWEIEPRERGAQDGAANVDDRAWHTRVTLALPTLGNIDANLVLTGQNLVVRLNASSDGALLLARDGDHFQQQLEAAGLQLAGLTVRAMDPLAESAGVFPPDAGAETAT